MITYVLPMDNNVAIMSMDKVNGYTLQNVFTILNVCKCCESACDGCDMYWYTEVKACTLIILL